MEILCDWCITNGRVVEATRFFVFPEENELYPQCDKCSTPNAIRDYSESFIPRSDDNDELYIAQRVLLE